MEIMVKRSCSSCLIAKWTTIMKKLFICENCAIVQCRRCGASEGVTYLVTQEMEGRRTVTMISCITCQLQDYERQNQDTEDVRTFYSD